MSTTKRKGARVGSATITPPSKTRKVPARAKNTIGVGSNGKTATREPAANRKRALTLFPQEIEPDQFELALSGDTIKLDAGKQYARGTVMYVIQKVKVLEVTQKDVEKDGFVDHTLHRHAAKVLTSKIMERKHGKDILDEYALGKTTQPESSKGK